MAWLLALVAVHAGLVSAREGVQVGERSAFAKLVPAEEVEASAAQQYKQMLSQARGKQAVATSQNAQLQRLRRIAQQLIPFAQEWNPRAKEWQWEVNLLRSDQVNAFCMPGGKIAFYTGILDKLQLTDDEVALVMGHEIAHALREHARERMGKTAATGIGANLITQIFGLGQVGQSITEMGAQLLTLRFSREDETEADLVGMELAARAGFNPRAGISLWTKMAQANRNAPPQWLSTHPASDTRIGDMEAAMPDVEPLYQRAKRPQ
ncbi:M48 family metallopeptidase [Curvibacter sp. CHRR-16]|uniref:M48 family metallopeptidase n=1 Tax=Curvibacter sp. CHRR-16 TaxID=2835872 RepID=UPI00202392FE|nr:M48 family metallopeptidase [Curvibacter sp. CHRR-16]